MRLTTAGVIAAAFILSVALYTSLPPMMPIHWNKAGHIDGYAPKALGLFLLPALMLVIAVIFRLLTRLGALPALMLWMVVAVFAVHLFVLTASLGFHVRVRGMRDITIVHSR